VKKISIAALAKKIFAAVESDLRDRRGIRHEWDHVDKEVQEEIRITNQQAIEKILRANR
jgi:hypothetical protein